MLTKEFIELLHSNNGKELVFEYEKGQEQINYPNDAAQEGIPATVVINEVVKCKCGHIIPVNELEAQAWEEIDERKDAAEAMLEDRYERD